MKKLQVTNVFSVNALGEPIGDYFVRTIHNRELLKAYPDLFHDLFMKEAESLLRKEMKSKNKPVFQFTWVKSDIEEFKPVEIGEVE